MRGGVWRRGAWRSSLAAATFAALVAAFSAWAFIPEAERIAGAVASTNAAAGRDQALRFELSLTIGDSPVLATGELLTHPSGLARLELRGANALVERHLLQGTEHFAARNGSMLETPREFLPPFFFTQAGSVTSLRAALAAFGVDPDQIALAPCSDSDCFVIGGPRTPIAASPAAVDEASESERETDNAEAVDLDLEPPPPAKVWIDVYSYRIVKFVLSNGVVVELGPPFTAKKVEVPQWLLVTEPSQETVRFEFENVSAVAVPARAFSRPWLLSGDAGSAGGAPAPPE